MKTLYQSLIDYDMALLQAIADCRGVTLDTASKSETITLLLEVLLSPAEVAIVIDDLAREEKQAFQLLLDNGGQIEGARFTRQFGVIRPMGPARLKREKPWQNPVNPAEKLWYKGLIFKAFQATLQGNSEIIYLPTDFIPLLAYSNAPDIEPPSTTPPDNEPGMPLTVEAGQDDHPEPVDQPAIDGGQGSATGTIIHDGAKIYQFRAPQKTDQEASAAEAGAPSSARKNIQAPYLTITKPPPVVVSGVGRLRESMFSLLVHLQTNPVRYTKGEELDPGTTQILAQQLQKRLLSHLMPKAEIDFLLHLGQRAGLLGVKHGRLRPLRDPVRTWLQSSEPEQTEFLQNTWRADPTWNDLWRVPTLVPQATGWENSPLLARSKILGYLNQEEILAGSWLSLDSFIAAIKRLDPDFQRPNGDYSSWYIYDADGESLMGFENWDLVEGALIRYIVTYILLLLGVVDVGLPNQNSAPNSFRITPQGETFLANRLTGKPEKPQKPVFLRVTANFQAYVPQAANLYDRFQLARFATLEQREEERVIYEINQASVGRALRNGVTPDQIVAFLARATNNQTPLKVVETLRLWGARQGTAYLERVTILRLKNAAQVQELQQHPALKPLLGDVLGPTTILIPSENTLKVRQLLTELGYLAGSEPN